MSWSGPKQKPRAVLAAPLGEGAAGWRWGTPGLSSWVTTGLAWLGICGHDQSDVLSFLQSPGSCCWLQSQGPLGHAAAPREQGGVWIPLHQLSLVVSCSVGPSDPAGAACP